MVELDWNQNWGGMATKQLGQLARMANRRRDQLDERTSRLSRHEMTHHCSVLFCSVLLTLIFLSFNNTVHGVGGSLNPIETRQNTGNNCI